MVSSRRYDPNDKSGAKALASAIADFMSIEGNTEEQARSLLDTELKRLAVLKAAEEAAEEAAGKAAREKLAELGWESEIPSQWQAK
jgi:hypothetical protein